MTRTALILAVLLTATAAGPPVASTAVTAPAPTLVIAISPSGDPAPANGPAPGSRGDSSAVTTAPAPGQAPRPTPVTPGGFTAAPIPDADINAPVRHDPSDSQASLGPSLFNTHDTYRGDGFLYKSTPQSEQEKRLKPTPGVSLSVPLQ